MILIFLILTAALLAGYVFYNYYFFYKKIKWNALKEVLHENFWVFDKKGKTVYSCNNSFSNFQDFLTKFEKCFHVYGERKDIIQKLTSFEPFETVIQKKRDQEFYACSFKSYDSCFLVHLKKMSESHVASSSSGDFLEQAPLGFALINQENQVVSFNQTAQEYFEDPLMDQNLIDLLNCDSLELGLQNIHNKIMLYLTNFDDRTRLCAFFPAMAYDGANQSFADFDIARIPALIMDKEGNIQKHNPALSQILKKFDIELGANFFNLIDKTRKSEIKSKYNRISESKNTLEPFETYFFNNDLITTTYTSRILEGNLFLLQFIDISEQKQLEQQFIQSQKMQAVGQLAGGIAHDFNNLLTAIIGFSDLLLQKYLPNDPSYSDLIQIKQNANRAANLVRQLLAFSRQQNLQPTILNVGDVLSELSALLHRLLGAKIDLQVKHGKNIHPIKTDMSQLEQVIINLAVNARDAMGYSGRLVITTENYETQKEVRMGHETMPKGKYVTISVQDTGCGIAPENLPHIFEPFFTTKKTGSGTGLGLSTVYGIIKQTGGFMSVHSELDVGSTFTVYMPAVDDAIFVPQTIKKHIIDLTGKERILLVEDEDAVRTFTGRALREKGYDVSEAVSGKEALDMIQKGCQFDLIVTDVVMPEIDGPTFLKEVRNKMPETKAIFISGYSDESLDYNLADEKITFFLPKPFTIKDLATKVKTSLQC